MDEGCCCLRLRVALSKCNRYMQDDCTRTAGNVDVDSRISIEAGRARIRIGARMGVLITPESTAMSIRARCRLRARVRVRIMIRAELRRHQSLFSVPSLSIIISAPSIIIQHTDFHTITYRATTCTTFTVMYDQSSRAGVLRCLSCWGPRPCGAACGSA